LLKGEKLIPSHDQSNYQIGYPLDKWFSVGYARKLRTEKQIIRKLIDCPIMKVKIEWNDLMSTVLLIWFNSDLTFKHQNTCILTESMILYVSNFLQCLIINTHIKYTITNNNCSTNNCITNNCITNKITADLSSCMLDNLQHRAHFVSLLWMFSSEGERTSV